MSKKLEFRFECEDCGAIFLFNHVHKLGCPKCHMQAEIQSLKNRLWRKELELADSYGEIHESIKELIGANSLEKPD